MKLLVRPQISAAGFSLSQCFFPLIFGLICRPRGRATSREGKVDGLELWNRLQDTAQCLSTSNAVGFEETTMRFGSPTLITPRLGQGAFRIAVTEAYRRQCAVSGGKVLPALDAAHIRPYAEGGLHKKSNG